MNKQRAPIDWEETRERLREAEEALEKALIPSEETVDRVYRERALQIAKPLDEPEEDARGTKTLVFSLGSETYGIAISELVEVLRSTTCTPAPRAPAAIAGVINLRGEIRSVIDLAQLLSLPVRIDDAASCILMLKNGREETGLKVGRVERVQLIREDNLASPEIGAADGQSSSSIKGLSPDKIIVLDAEALRSHPIFGAEQETSLHPPRLLSTSP